MRLRLAGGVEGGSGSAVDIGRRTLVDPKGRITEQVLESMRLKTDNGAVLPLYDI